MVPFGRWSLAFEQREDKQFFLPSFRSTGIHCNSIAVIIGRVLAKLPSFRFFSLECPFIMCLKAPPDWVPLCVCLCVPSGQRRTQNLYLSAGGQKQQISDLPRKERRKFTTIIDPTFWVKNGRKKVLSPGESISLVRSLLTGLINFLLPPSKRKKFLYRMHAL